MTRTNGNHRKFALGAAALAAFAAIAATPVVADDWRGWNIHPPTYPNGIALDAFAKEVAETTDGRVTPTVYHNAVLGDQPDAIEQARNGALDFGNFNMGPMGPIVPATNILSLPFIFASVDQMHTVMDGEIGQRFSDALAEKGLVALSWFDSGARSLYNTRAPVKTPADVEGLKVRVMNNQLYVDMIGALGGNATPMAFGEVYQSLKTGVIDGAENNYPSYESTNHFEVARFYSITEHLIIPECLCVSTASWDALSDEDKAAVKAAAVNAAAMQRELWAEREKASLAKVREAGAQINEVEDKAAFQSAMDPVYAGFIEKNPDLKSWIDDIKATK
ncbi:tripartite ATP-independent transporter solute receptor, DctP family [Albimonas donghaensis]|uniref:Tripartite ATP-independent transporter solute receptor, DctP family n=1 Tax=Albimonas donghaensis TaxID=356660 RepID=A0A1H2YAP7_9RHOB|nr:TRAP transporter substrate-binding protein [Albimonas donghaensis]SDX02216.1 tripartite ATP-independent transporter solute receptor, DctP family [Albimonas donghaensis]